MLPVRGMISEHLTSVFKVNTNISVVAFICTSATQGLKENTRLSEIINCSGFKPADRGIVQTVKHSDNWSVHFNYLRLKYHALISHLV